MTDAPDLEPTALTIDEIERIILKTEPPYMSDRGDRIWTRRMAVALADRFNALLSARSAPEAGKAVGAPTHRHLKTGHLVRVIGTGRMQMSTVPAQDMDDVVIYEHDGNLWARAHWEFYDGRFAALPPSALASSPAPTGEIGEALAELSKKIASTQSSVEPEFADALYSNRAEQYRTFDAPPPQPVAPTGEIAGLRRMSDAHREHAQSAVEHNATLNRLLSIAEARADRLEAEAAAALTSLSAERDRANESLREVQFVFGQTAGALERSEAEVADLRRKLEEHQDAEDKAAREMATVIQGLRDRATAAERKLEEARKALSWRTDMENAPKDGTVVNVVGRYPDATAGFPRYAAFLEEEGDWFELSRNNPERVVPWAWRPREEWPDESAAPLPEDTHHG